MPGRTTSVFSQTQSFMNDEDDPLTRAIAPPPNETPAQRQERIAAEQAALKRSRAIDEELDRQRAADKKAPKCVKVLLLGQSESGKSTTLKNFQLINSPKCFKTERASWRAIVQLNVVRSIKLILDAMNEAQNAHRVITPTSSLDQLSNSTRARSPPPEPQTEYPPLTPDLLKLKMRLAPLQQVEETLLRKLAPVGSREFEATHLAPLTNLPYDTRSDASRKEVSVYSASQWKGAFTRLISNGRSSMDSNVETIDFDDPNDPGVVIHACSEDMMRLWSDPTVRKILRVHKLRLEDTPGFFLDSLDRVTSVRYVPTDDDILRARIKTLGVSEHRFNLKAGNVVSSDWRVYDVGGARSLRAAWVPYFDDLDAIIFLAPISCFDQVLTEDASVNRLEDSILLWKSVVSHPLLKSTAIILFLNKIDILKRKLEADIKFADYVVSYGDRPNTYDAISNYLQKKFAGLHKSHTSTNRPFYTHLTSVTDPKSTSTILGNVKDQIVRRNLQNSALLQ